MDGLSVATSILTLVSAASFAGKVAKRLKDGPEEFAQLGEELSRLKGLAREFEKCRMTVHHEELAAAGRDPSATTPDAEKITSRDWPRRCRRLSRPWKTRS